MSYFVIESLLQSSFAEPGAWSLRYEYLMFLDLEYPCQGQVGLTTYKYTEEFMGSRVSGKACGVCGDG